MLDSKFPTLEKITGVDLSTYKLAICENKKKEMVIIFYFFYFLIYIIIIIFFY
jgi:hypothetical protein